MAAITLTGTIKRRRKETITIITVTARNNKRKVEIVRNNLNGRMKTARSRQKTATEGKGTIDREITITTGTEDKTRDGITKTDVRKGNFYYSKLNVKCKRNLNIHMYKNHIKSLCFLRKINQRAEKTKMDGAAYSSIHKRKRQTYFIRRSALEIRRCSTPVSERTISFPSTS